MGDDERFTYIRVFKSYHSHTGSRREDIGRAHKTRSLTNPSQGNFRERTNGTKRGWRFVNCGTSTTAGRLDKGSASGFDEVTFRASTGLDRIARHGSVQQYRLKSLKSPN